MTVENKESGSVTGNRTDYILNGLTDTYKVNTGDNTVTDSIINAYETAVAFDTSGGKLTLSGTIVNGGLDGASNAITGGTGNDVLVLQSGITNSIVNGNIDLEREIIPSKVEMELL